MKVVIAYGARAISAWGISRREATMAVTANTDGDDVAVALSFPETDMIHHFRITALLTVARSPAW